MISSPLAGKNSQQLALIYLHPWRWSYLSCSGCFKILKIIFIFSKRRQTNKPTPQNWLLTFVLGTTLRPSLRSTRLAPASDRYPWFGIKQFLPKQHGQQILWHHFVHLGFKCPYGSSSLGLNTPIFFCKQRNKKVHNLKINSTDVYHQFCCNRQKSVYNRHYLQDLNRHAVSTSAVF